MISRSRGVGPLRVAHHGDRLIRVGAGRRPPDAVDDILDATRAGCGEENGQQIVQASRWQGSGNLKGVRGKDAYALVEEAVAAHPISAEAGYRAGNLEGRPAIDAGRLHPGRLAGWVVGHLILEEDVRATVPIPDHFVLLVVLDEQAIRGHVVTVDDDAGVGSVVVPTHTVAVIGPPCPDVIEDDVFAVDD